VKLCKTLILAILAISAGAGLSAQYAPQSIADSLVSIHGRVSVFWSYELILFRADGTYQVIISQGYSDSETGVQTYPPANGTYTYTATPAGSGFNGTITFTSGNSGYSSVRFGSGGSFEYPTIVTVYPPVAFTGAVNVSNNSWVSSTHPALSGFVIEGSSPRWVLIRGDGPSLSQFGVASPASNPTITVSSAQPNTYSIYLSVNLQGVSTETQAPSTSPVNSWSSDPNLVPGFQAIFSLAGAFQYPSASADCAALVLLQPGAYLVNSSSNGPAGEVLTEVYVLPYGDQSISSDIF
jgi:hypothetical protein